MLSRLENRVPVAAVERGKSVLVAKDMSFSVADHDFTKVKVIPSVSLLCDMPEDIGGSFYSGNVTVCLKEAAFSPSSPLRHATELLQTLREKKVNSVLKPVLLLYTDGGPDHRVNFISVQLALICLFLHLQLDYLVAARTAPMQSYRNPVERMISLLNLGLQSVGWMRLAMPEKLEEMYAKCPGLDETRCTAERHPELKPALQESVQPAIQLMEEVFSRLKVHEEPVTTMKPASEEEMDELWQEMKTVDPTVNRSDTTAEKVRNKTKLNEFMAHCCTTRHYFFAIKKCGNVDCSLCGRPTLPEAEFQALHQFPDPIKRADQSHYKPFEEVWGKETTEKDRPSLSSGKSSHTCLEGVSFNAKAETETVLAILTCGECSKPRCLHSVKKLTDEHKRLVAQLQKDSVQCVFAELP